jgi:RNA polymerase sigma-70 factor (ECF subfamily)
LQGVGSSWEELLARVAAGQRDALAQIYDGSSRMVYGLTLRILREPEDAEEVTLDVYAEVWKKASRFDPERGGARVFLATLARSRALDLLRKRKRERERERPIASAPEPEATTNPEADAALAERQERVRRALDALPTGEREAIELAFFSGLSYREVALALGQPEGTVKSRIRSGLSRLRDRLRGD